MARSGRKIAGTIALTTTAVIALWATGGLGQNLTPAPFTAAQVESGRAAYVASCMNCHGDSLAGTGDAPPIAGRSFMIAWGARTTKDFYEAIQVGMPVGRPGSLPDQTYADIVAFILHANGAASGTSPLTPATAVRISSVASGTLSADVAGGIKLAQAAPAAGVDIQAAGN